MCAFCGNEEGKYIVESQLDYLFFTESIVSWFCHCSGTVAAQCLLLDTIFDLPNRRDISTLTERTVSLLSASRVILRQAKENKIPCDQFAMRVFFSKSPKLCSVSFRPEEDRNPDVNVQSAEDIVSMAKDMGQCVDWKAVEEGSEIVKSLSETSHSDLLKLVERKKVEAARRKSILKIIKISLAFAAVAIVLGVFLRK